MARRLLLLGLGALQLCVALAQESPSPTPSPKPSPSASAVPSQTQAPQPQAQPSPARATSEEQAQPRDVYDLLFTLIARGKPPRYSTHEIQVRAGQIVALNFVNETPAEQGRILNWVLVEAGKADEVRSLGVNAGKDPGGIEYTPDVMAATGPVAPGESDAISFEVPRAPGRYRFLCTAPGCTEEMQGFLVVRPIA